MSIKDDPSVLDDLSDDECVQMLWEELLQIPRYDVIRQKEWIKEYCYG